MDRMGQGKSERGAEPSLVRTIQELHSEILELSLIVRVAQDDENAPPAKRIEERRPVAKVGDGRLTTMSDAMERLSEMIQAVRRMKVHEQRVNDVLGIDSN